MTEERPPEGQEVRECGLVFSPDKLAGFECATLELSEEDDGPLAATLTRRSASENQAGDAVLYVHGFIDYFFQIHLANAIETAGFRFYALDLRRYGRSIRPHNRLGTAAQIEDYFEELGWALGALQKRHPRIAGLIGHSTGGLVCALYCAEEKSRNLPDRLLLNSPFLRFNLGAWDLMLSHLAAFCGRFFPHWLLPQTTGSTYGETLHVSGQGEWDYELDKKPKEGFPLYAGWFRMIHEAHKRVRKGLRLNLPVLCLHSSASHRAGSTPGPEDFRADIVLNVEHIKEGAPRLGTRVTMLEIQGAVHDVLLSHREARDRALEAMVRFLKTPV